MAIDAELVQVEDLVFRNFGATRDVIFSSRPYEEPVGNDADNGDCKPGNDAPAGIARVRFEVSGTLHNSRRQQSGDSTHFRFRMGCTSV
ncbi:hypothetical protein QO002_005160 [Pararhizobium capsulatum DSM 1112]|uniref:Uncharacterized protein n=1 Tax=Pararhizobium capsulatum DSM 1112 TaxID=1121113 RepID=A0ABU0BXH4_9HYPH|nr:hypothetical protein [Pararhizobium capsulatum DSM 1112]